MTCKNCGGTNLNQQGYAIVGSDRDEEWAKKFLNDKMYTCLDCKGTFIYKEVQNGEENGRKKDSRG